MQIKEAKQHIEIFEMALRSKQCLGEQELEEYKLCQSIDTVLNELEKKDKVIDEMAMYLADIDFDECCAEIPEPCLSCSWEDYEPHTNCIKEYFYKKVGEEYDAVRR